MVNHAELSRFLFWNNPQRQNMMPYYCKPPRSGCSKGPDVLPKRTYLLNFSKTTFIYSKIDPELATGSKRWALKNVTEDTENHRKTLLPKNGLMPYCGTPLYLPSPVSSPFTEASLGWHSCLHQHDEPFYSTLWELKAYALLDCTLWGKRKEGTSWKG